MGILVSYRAPDDQRYAAIVAARLRGFDVPVRVFGKQQNDGVWLKSLEKRSRAFDYCIAIVSSDRLVRNLAGKAAHLNLSQSNILFLVLHSEYSANQMPARSVTIGPFIYADFGNPAFWRKFTRRLGIESDEADASTGSEAQASVRPAPSNVQAIYDDRSGDFEGSPAGLASVDLVIGGPACAERALGRFHELRHRLITSNAGSAELASGEDAIRRMIASPYGAAVSRGPPTVGGDAEIIDLQTERRNGGAEASRRPSSPAIVSHPGLLDGSSDPAGGATVIPLAAARASRVAPANTTVETVLSGLAYGSPRRLAQIASCRLGIVSEDQVLRVPSPHPALSEEDRALAFEVMRSIVGTSGKVDWARAAACGGSVSLLARDELRRNWAMDLLNFIQRIKRGG